MQEHGLRPCDENHKIADHDNRNKVSVILSQLDLKITESIKNLNSRDNFTTLLEQKLSILNEQTQTDDNTASQILRFQEIKLKKILRVKNNNIELPSI